MNWKNTCLRRCEISLRPLLLAFLLAAVANSSYGQTLYTGNTSSATGSSGLWNSARWSGTSTGPFTAAFTANSAVEFPSGNYSFTGAGTGLNVGNITVGANATVVFGSNSNTFATGNNVRTITLAAGSFFDFGNQTINTNSGFIKAGTGVFAPGPGYGRGLTLNAGTVLVAASLRLGTGTAHTLTLNGGTLASSTTSITFGTNQFGGGIVIGGDVQFGQLQSNLPLLLPAQADTAGLSFPSNTPVSLGGSGTITLTNGNNGAQVFNGVISGSSGLAFAANAGTTGRFELAGANTYTGNTTINSGTVRLTTGSNRLPTGTVVSLGQSASANVGRLDLGGQNQQIAGLVSIAGTNASGLTNVVTSTAAATLTIDNTGNWTYGDGTAANSGVISGAISLVKNGAGLQTLGGANNYTGTTAVNAGTLVVNGSLGAGDVSVGGVLAGSNGTIGGNTAIFSGGFINAGTGLGNDAATLNFSRTLTLGGVATIDILGDLAGQFDVLRGDGGDVLAFGGVLALNNTGYANNANVGDSITIFSNWGSFSGSFTSITGTDLGNGLQWDTSTLSTNGTLTVIAVPEPSSLALLAGCAVAAGLWRKRRNRRRTASEG